MKTLTLLLAIGLVPACSRAPAVEYDAAASKAFYAAWKKGAAGDEAGKRAALAEIARRYPRSRAGLRAEELLHPAATGASSPGGIGALLMGLIAGAGYFAAGKAPPFGSPLAK